MCTALSFLTRDHYFGRTLDLEFHYDERVAVTPRNMPFHFRKMGDMPRHQGHGDADEQPQHPPPVRGGR